MIQRIFLFFYMVLDPCTTVPSNVNQEGKECVFPFLYKGKSYRKCTTDFSENGRSWCAIDIQPLTEVPEDGLHWGDCEQHCPGAG